MPGYDDDGNILTLFVVNLQAINVVRTLKINAIAVCLLSNVCDADEMPANISSRFFSRHCKQEMKKEREKKHRKKTQCVQKESKQKRKKINGKNVIRNE